MLFMGVNGVERGVRGVNVLIGILEEDIFCNVYAVALEGVICLNLFGALGHNTN